MQVFERVVLRCKDAVEAAGFECSEHRRHPRDREGYGSVGDEVDLIAHLPGTMTSPFRVSFHAGRHKCTDGIILEGDSFSYDPLEYGLWHRGPHRIEGDHATIIAERAFDFSYSDPDLDIQGIVGMVRDHATAEAVKAGIEGKSLVNEAQFGAMLAIGLHKIGPVEANRILVQLVKQAAIANPDFAKSVQDAITTSLAGGKIETVPTPTIEPENDVPSFR